MIPSAALAKAAKAAFVAWPACVWAAWGPLALTAWHGVLNLDRPPGPDWLAHFAADVILSTVAAVLIGVTLLRRAGLGPGRLSIVALAAMLMASLSWQVSLSCLDLVWQGAGFAAWSSLAGTEPRVEPVIGIAAAALGLMIFYAASRLSFLTFPIVAGLRADVRRAWGMGGRASITLLVLNSVWTAWNLTPQLAGSVLEKGPAAWAFLALTTLAIYPLVFAFAFQLWLQLDPPPRVADVFD